MANYIDKAKLVGEVLTSGENQLRFRQMTGEEAYFEVLKMVGDMPTADVAEARHGYWVTTDTPLGQCCVCSICGGCPTMEYRYCPYCGSRMDGGPDNDQL